MSRQVDQNERAPLRTMPWWVAVIGTAAVALSATFTTLWLLSIAGHAASLRIEAIKVGLSVGAGMGGAVALLLAVRRQWLSERTQAHAEDVARDNAYDATQRRVTELYGKAVEQLGHTNAPVRLGGLYSLERLAQDHREHRQTVVDVICAYLRMPFDPAPSAPTDDQPPTADEDSGNRPKGIGHDDSDAREELQVRLAAQRLLARHLALPDDHGPGNQHTTASRTYWAGMRIDLNGAHLVDFDFDQCQTDHADFRNSQFHGDALFLRAEFCGDARFDDALFSENVWFSDAQFTGSANFDSVQFKGNAWFDETQFTGGAKFDSAKFSEGVWLRAARFGTYAWFNKARFSGDAEFNGAGFDGDAWFDRAHFAEGVGFNDAHFSGEVSFDDTQFSTQPDFTRAVACHPDVRHTWPDGWQIEQSSPPGMAPLIRRK